MPFPKQFGGNTKEILTTWRESILDKHKDDDESDEIYCNDPLLIIEYNRLGLTSRNISEYDVAQVIRTTPGKKFKVMPFPKQFGGNTKEILTTWRESILDKHKDDDESDEIYCNDPLLIIEYNRLGLTSRNISEYDVAQVIRTTPGYVPFPNASHPFQSNSVIAFNDLQALENAINQLFLNYNNLLLNLNHPIIGRVYVVIFQKSGTFEACERSNIFG
ncbi:hypothetical protein Glove_123g108 [Diversispora epigaea]|uniref:Uncharacterized protein n=1 Tax=Diversispora epigaea TaxID=1348612 RepID=A0A397J7E1_9GLOM|nr:hypothetical protein Glove_123g108 [Diversispora epigaea]